jgi:RNA recognition motif-containing protein
MFHDTVQTNALTMRNGEKSCPDEALESPSAPMIPPKDELCQESSNSSACGTQQKDKKKAAHQDDKARPTAHGISGQDGDDAHTATLYIGGLHPRVARAHMEKLLQPFGNIQRLNFLEKRGICFCQYSSPSEARAAQTALHGRTLLGRMLKVQPATRSKEGACNKSRGGEVSLDARIQALKRKLQEKKER